MSDDAPDDLARSAALFRRATEPVFILDRQRRVRFVNPAWEALTGTSAEAVRGQVCATTRRSDKPLSPLLHALAPPPEVLAGSPARARRPVPPARTGPPWWEVDFLPVSDADGFLGVVGRVSVQSGPPPRPGDRVLGEPLAALRDRAAAAYDFDLYAGDTPAMARVAAQARLAAATPAPVLVTGPPGCGKRTLARVVHHRGVTRSAGFVALDADGLPAAALTAVLFGSNGLAAPERLGTLYLRRPERLPREVQAQLADWLAGRAPDRGPRLVAGTDADPATGPMLETLYHALNVLPITLPGLRERMADLPALADRLLARMRGAGLTTVSGLTPAALESLTAHDWPDNLRELDAVLAEAAGRASSSHIDAGDLPAEFGRRAALERTPGGPPPRPLELDKVLEQVERRLIELALKRHGGNKSRAAEMLNVWRPRFYERLKALGIAPADGPAGG
jgi:DNA-binding NtrC family response regulator